MVNFQRNCRESRCEVSLCRHGRHAHFPRQSRLLGELRLGIVPLKAAQPGGRCSQGGVKVPTGGKGQEAQARERLLRLRGRVSRFGAIPKPTVKVRMKENGRCAAFSRRIDPYALILVLKEESHESDVARPGSKAL